MSVIMLGGVATFSYIMSIFINTLQVFKSFNKDFSEGDLLTKFFSVLSKMNNRELKNEIKQEITAYFEFKWIKDKNMAICSREDMDLLN